MAVVGPAEILDRVATFLAAGHSEWRWADDLFSSTADGVDRFHFSGGERSADCCWDHLMRFMLVFGLLGMFLAALAIRLARDAHGAWWWLVGTEGYFTSCFLAVAAIYGLRTVGLSVEDIPRRSIGSFILRAVLLPYLALGGLTLYFARWFNSEGLLNPVAPGLCIGRLPFPSERPRLRDAGVQAVLNLCWEFPRLSGVDGKPGYDTAHVPIVDGAAPTDSQFRAAVETVARWHGAGRYILIHCAQGHGRSATIAAAVLVQLALAADVEQALARIRVARPFAKPSREQKVALIRYLSLAPVNGVASRT
jgi:Dual specificity phosphatase, catalytic domain